MSNDAATPTISVVICTRNRAGQLRTSLGSIRAASERSPHAVVELVVVDNGSTDGTSAVVEQWAAEDGMPTRLLYESRPGLAIARNTGIAAARGEIIVLTDDDCCLDADYFSNLLKAYSGDNKEIIVGGRIELGDPRDLPMTIKTEKTPAVFDGMNPGTFVAGCNMTLHRSVWQRVGPMDERFGAGSPLMASEETDYIYRAFLAGIPVLYNPDLCVHHFHGRRTVSQAKALWRAYSIGGGGLFAKHVRTPLIRNLRWNCKNAAFELLGLARLDPELGFTYRAMVWCNFKGMARYWWREMTLRSVPRDDAPRTTAAIPDGSRSAGSKAGRLSPQRTNPTSDMTGDPSARH